MYIKCILSKCIYFIDKKIVICRLSDYLFTVARVAAKESGKEEKIYKRIQPRDTEESS